MPNQQLDLNALREEGSTSEIEEAPRPLERGAIFFSIRQSEVPS